MKKKTLFFVLALALLLTSCNYALIPENPEASITPNESTMPPEPSKPEELSDYLIEEDGKQYLILPVSNTKINVDKYRSHLTKIDLEMLRAADKKLSEEIKHHSENSGIYMAVDYGGELWLAFEAIVKIDPPNISEYGFSGCGIDHDHMFYKEKITG